MGRVIVEFPECREVLVDGVARLLLMKSADFRKAMRDLDSAWQPSEVAIDPVLRARVCSP
jgi:hypothetical protein